MTSLQELATKTLLDNLVVWKGKEYLAAGGVPLSFSLGSRCCTLCPSSLIFGTRGRRKKPCGFIFVLLERRSWAKRFRYYVLGRSSYPGGCTSLTGAPKTTLAVFGKCSIDTSFSRQPRLLRHRLQFDGFVVRVSLLEIRPR